MKNQQIKKKIVSLIIMALAALSLSTCAFADMRPPLHNPVRPPVVEEPIEEE